MKKRKVHAGETEERDFGGMWPQELKLADNTKGKRS